MSDHSVRIHPEALHCSHSDDGLRFRGGDERQQRLFSAYPLFFRATRYPRIYPSNIANLGIQCGLGWYSLIEDAASEIELELQAMWTAQTRMPEGLALIDQGLLTDANEVEYPVIPFCYDIAEAAGELKILVINGHLGEVEPWLRICQSVKNAVARARSTCERCGNPGELRKIYWHHVYCEECIAPMDFKHYRPAAE